MYVCSCRGVTDRTVQAAIASGAGTVEEIANRCGAGARCGGCWPELERLLAESARRAAQRDTRVAV
jgi:bacterioferritin-associated ferredoxin